jgi:hypothetical protein
VPPAWLKAFSICSIWALQGPASAAEMQAACMMQSVSPTGAILM